ncbi:TIR domain-containing protein [Nocardia bhagyanarayanae]|uniref:WD40 repeat protein n=1 Tax=Nocardia bhagyanarayanae TaxID=1215925 RepID=A0A543FAK3_9NOCA|nr:TIR domain-containing protein [Nocardia bhagyanarayanae]TQM30854.1 WD40 repeat protein [Nocardia bhagyanarayanae]
MSRVFLSHSSRDTREAVALKAWLIEADPGLADEIFLDLDRRTGIRAGVRWKDALRRASERCEAVICLLSDNWDASHECKTEYRSAETLGKPIFAVRLQPLKGRDITSEWQRCDLFGAGPHTSISVDDGPPVEFRTEGLLRLRDGLRAAGIGADTFAWPPPGDPERAPYRGWQPLEAVDAAVYFGRDAQIGRALSAIRALRNSGVGQLFVVLGPSGVGKSSFLRAGLLPRLQRDDRHYLPAGIVRPQRYALTGDGGLAQTIHRLRVDLGLHQPSLGVIKEGIRDVARVRAWLAEAQRAARERIVDPTDDEPPTLVFSLDQAEELFGVDADEEARALLALVGELLDQRTAMPMVVIATIRADRYEPLQTAPELADVAVRPFDDLKPMPQAQFKEVICGPARRAREAGSKLAFAPELVDRLLEDWSHGADTLPLLSLTLARLYQDYGDGEITLAEYEAMGGLRRVVQSEIDELLAVDPAVREEQLAVLRTAFVPWLATVDPDSDQPMRRVARWFDLPAPSRPLLESFIARRLLVRDERDGEIVVEVALESLLRQWEALAEWLRVEAADLKDADNLERAALAWERNGRNEEWLLAGSRLADAESLVVEPGFRDRLEHVREFLSAARKREDRLLAEEQEHREAELRAARDRQEAAEALAAAESRAKEDAERHARMLRKRSRILRAALIVVAVVAMVAAVGFAWALRAENRARSNARDTSAAALGARSQLMLSESWPGKSDDVFGMQMALAASSFPSKTDGHFAVLNAIHQTRNVNKIYGLDGASAYSVQFSPDGTRVATTRGDSIELVDAGTWQRIGALMTGHEFEVNKLAFSPDGRRIASASRDGTVRLWDTETQQPIGEPLRGHIGPVMTVAFSPDGSALVSGGVDKTVRLWDAETRRPIGEPMTGSEREVMSVAFGADDLIASSGLDGAIRLWNRASRQPVGAIPTGQFSLNSVVFSPDGTKLASAGSDATIQLWDPRTRLPIGEPLRGHTAVIEQVTFSRDGARLASVSDDKTVRTWDVASGRPVGEMLRGHESAVMSVAFHPDGHRIVTGGLDSTVREWIGNPGTVYREGPVVSLAISPDGRRLVSSTGDGTISQSEIDTGKQVGPVVHGDVLEGAGYSADGRQLESIAPSHLRMWDTNTGAPVGAPIQFPPETKLAFTNGERTAALFTESSGQLWSLPSMQPIGPPLDEANGVMSAEFSRDGKVLAAGGTDWVLRLWDATTGLRIGKPMEGKGWVSDITFSPDDRRLAVGYYDRSVRLWNVETGEQIGNPMWHDGWVMDVEFSPDGTTLATGSVDGNVRLWDAASQRQIGPAMIGHTGVISDVDFTPDGARIISASADKTIRIWPVSTFDTDKLCAKMTYNMSRETWNEWVSPDIEYEKVCPDLPIAGEEGG